MLNFKVELVWKSWCFGVFCAWAL